jgi:hypothetical protein
MQKTHRVGLITALLFTAALSSPAHAALDDQLSEHAKDTTTVTIAGQRLRVRERGHVREFADANGKVFAARWNGHVMLSTLLGAHFPAYLAAMKAQKRRSLHAVEVVTPELLVSSVVYGALAQGQVVLVKQLPKGVTADALR